MHTTAFETIWGGKRLYVPPAVGLSKVPAVKRLYYGLGRNSVLFNVGQSSSSLFFLPSGLFAQIIIM